LHTDRLYRAAFKGICRAKFCAINQVRSSLRWQVKRAVRQDNVLKPVKKHDLPMTNKDIPQEYYGWWRIIDTSQWAKKHIDTLGTALISLTGYDDRLRMFALLAYVNCKVTKTGFRSHGKGLGSTTLSAELGA